MTLIDFMHRAEAKAFRVANRALRSHPSSDPYVSGDAFRAIADHVLDMDSGIDPRTVARGDVVFVETHRIPQFKAEVLPEIEARFVLVTHNSDWQIEDTLTGVADDRRVAGWFAQNVLCRHEKIVHVPIGLENRWRHGNGLVGDYRRLARMRIEKRPRILYAFSVGTNVKERQPAFDSLRKARAADEHSWTNSRAYRTKLNEYSFVASPPGNGVDCHRTWEALYLGVVPIVKRSALYEGFPGLPVLFIDDWREIEDLDEARLAEIYDRVHLPPQKIAFLWMEYWHSAIEAVRREA